MTRAAGATGATTAMLETPADRPEVQDQVPDARVVLRPLATPLSLGFLGLAAASLTASGLQLHWVPAGSDWTTVGLVLMVFPVPLQAIAAVMGFLSRDAVAATGFGVLSASWLALGAATFTGAPGRLSAGLGLLLVGAAVCMLVPAIAGWSSKAVAAAVVGLAAVRFGLTGAYEISGTSTWSDAAGICGLVLFGLAVYAALAFELESTQRRTVLPTGRRGRGAIALGGTFDEEVAGVHHEAGVRQQL